MDKKLQESKKQFGTLTAKQDANNDYSSSTSSSSSASQGLSSAMNSRLQSQMSQNQSTSGSTASQQGQATSAKQQASKNQYGTLTAKMDANEDYE